MEFHHVSVLYEETMRALQIRPDGLYVDCTAGGGGHSAGILERLTTGRLIAVDQDPDAIKTLRERFANAPNVTVVHDNFVNIDAILSSMDLEGSCVDGILADLGVSSFQLDNADRGFSYHKDAPLDMRMGRAGVSAKDLVNTLPQQTLQELLFRYGEEKFAPSLARQIVKARETAPIETTLQLAEIVANAVPAKARRDGHPARRTFQALRIEVNGELEKLEQALDVMFDRLNVGGRLAVITFHSLEDRIVKQHFRKLCEGCVCPPEFPVCVCGRVPRGKLPCRPATPTAEELEANPRARSAKLRVIEKINL